MATLFGQNYTKRELQKRVGDMSQIAGIRPVKFKNGNEEGLRALEFTTGSGLQFTVLADRAMDIYDAKFNGQSLTWHSQAGPVAPEFYDPHDIGWLWNMAGGLVVTCGLTQAGPAEVDGDEELGVHGRIANMPAKNVSFGTEWEDDEYVLYATGEMREARIFGYNLLMRRSIHTQLGQSRIRIQDEIINDGFEKAPLMFLYHCNMGFPIVDQGSELLAVIENMVPRDRDAESGVANFDTFEAPTPEYAEQCFFIDHDVDDKGLVHVGLVNRNFNNGQGFGVYMSYLKKELPQYTQWKMVGEGNYVVGMEPGNCIPEGRATARKRGSLEFVEPGEKRTFHLEIGVMPSNNEIRAFEAKLRGLTE